MMKSATKVSAILMTAAALTMAMAPAQASGELPVYKACLAKAETASDRKSAEDQCMWDHWEMMGEYGK